MDYDHAVRQTWRHSEPILMRSNVRELVRYATLAASSHNTQPWRFEITTDESASSRILRAAAPRWTLTIIISTRVSVARRREPFAGRRGGRLQGVR